MSYGTVQAEKMTTESGYSLGAGNASSFKNRIINGGMVIDQRNAGASGTVGPSTSTDYRVDRFFFQRFGGTATFTGSQSTTAPAGFTNSLSATVAIAAAPAAGDTTFIRQLIEGFNVADLGFGAAGAQSVTVSFWVNSSITGTYGGSVTNGAFDRSYVFTYSINSANTWEQKTITVPGDTTGTWLKNSSAGMRLNLDLGSGSNMNGTANTWTSSTTMRTSGCVNWIANAGATFYLTGVQLEVGTVATSFDFRDIGTELDLCSRYFQKSYQQDTVGGTATFTGASFIGAGTQGAALTTGYIEAREPFPVRMRTSPTITGWDTSGNLGKCTRFNPNTANNTNESASFAGTERYVNCTSGSGANASTLGFHWYCSAEL
jgi:hypothetical protein